MKSYIRNVYFSQYMAELTMTTDVTNNYLSRLLCNGRFNKRIVEQAAAELGQAQPQLGLGLT